MKEETPKEFEQLMYSIIEDVNRGVSVRQDLAILEDLKRLGDMGILTVTIDGTIPQVEINKDPLSVKLLIRQPRLSFHGEDLIIELRQEIERLKSYHKEDIINAFNEGAKGLVHFTNPPNAYTAEDYYEKEVKPRYTND